jgi:ribosome-associated translation inhibitor RaiA
VEEKLGSLAKFLANFEAQGVDELTVTVSRTTSHHAKGDVFEAKADLRLPKKVLRIRESGSDIRVVVDLVKKKLQMEIKKYKTLYSESTKKRK